MILCIFMPKAGHVLGWQKFKGWVLKINVYCT